ncbi:MAG: ATP-binding protein [Lachnospiraceae bacterium]|jgi:hypothetical protein
MMEAVMRVFVNFLFECLFTTDLLAIGFAAVCRIPKRKRGALRVIAAVAGCIAFSVVWDRVSGILRGMPALGAGLSPGESVAQGLLSMSGFILTFLAVLAALKFCVEISWWSAVYIGAGTWLIQNMSSHGESLLPVIDGISLPAYGMHYLVLFCFLLPVWLLFYRRIDSYTLNRLNYRTVLPVLIIMCLICMVINLMGDTSPAFHAAMILCSVLGLLYQYSIYRYMGYLRDRDTVSSLLAQEHRQYEISKSSIDLVNIKAHDLRHQIRKFRRQETVSPQVLDEMEQVVNEYDNTVRTSNEALDVILTEKSIACREKGIGFTCMAEGSGLNYIAPGDLYALFGNAIENAMEATEKLENPDQKQISLTIHRSGDLYTVILQNYCREPVKVVDGLLATTKSDPQNHGFGMRSMKMLVEKYGGEMHFGQEDEIVTLTILLPARDAGTDTPA